VAPSMYLCVVDWSGGEVKGQREGPLVEEGTWFWASNKIERPPTIGECVKPAKLSPTQPLSALFIF